MRRRLCYHPGFLGFSLTSEVLLWTSNLPHALQDSRSRRRLVCVLRQAPGSYEDLARIYAAKSRFPAFALTGSKKNFEISISSGDQDQVFSYCLLFCGEFPKLGAP
jgi:hypothetical protein